MKVLLYCTKAKPKIYSYETLMTNSFSKGREFELNGKVVASFELNKVDEIENRIAAFIINKDSAYTETIAKNSCVGFDDLKKYLGNKNGYAWHIDNLKIFDEPIELGELYSYNELKRVMHPTDNDLDTTLLRLEAFNGNLKDYFLTKAPQSYQYVYYKGEKCLLLSIKSEWVYKILNGEKTVEIRKTLPKEVR